VQPISSLNGCCAKQRKPVCLYKGLDETPFDVFKLDKDEKQNAWERYG